jgi:hypothetical protein
VLCLLQFLILVWAREFDSPEEVITEFYRECSLGKIMYKHSVDFPWLLINFSPELHTIFG